MDIEKPNCIGCHHIHPDNGNCTAVGGFCTAVPAAHCPLIPELRAENEKMRAELECVTAERNAAQALLAERSGVTGSAPITTAFGIPLERIRELVEAAREGRCVVLPKDGMVYYIEEAGGEKWIGNKPIQQVILRCGFGMALLEFSLFDKGKYFSRAEAEDALRREQE